MRGWGNCGRLSLFFANLVWRPAKTQADIVVTHGFRLDDFGLDAVILHTPGHTLGSCSLILADDYAFVGDLISSRPQPRVQESYAQDWAVLAGSLEWLSELDPAWAFPGHGEPVTREELRRMWGEEAN